MQTGKVKFFNRSKRYGFIKGDGFRTLKENDKVEFEVEDGDKGKKAVNVSIID